MRYIEDIFIDFYSLVSLGKISVQWHDSTPIDSFAETISAGNNLTKSQSLYVLRLLSKYKNQVAACGIDYESDLVNPVWKKSFRVIDTSKRIHVELNPEDGYPQVCLKFPFEFKKTFDLEFNDALTKASLKTWDNDRKLRVIPLHDINLVALSDFASKHGFEIDPTFEAVTATIEETWNQQDNVIPFSEVANGEVIIKNAIDDAAQWWEEHKTANLSENLLLAKSMGFPARLNYVPTGPIEKIAASTETAFWIHDNKTFFDIYKELSNGCVCIVLDRTSDTHAWIRDFVLESTVAGVDRADIKVCFRETDLSKSRNFNDWVKESGIGGSVDTGRIFIFENKPAKWLFTKNIDVKLIVTNNLYPNTHTMTQQWIENHPCVLHIGDIRPSQKRNLKIVEL